MQPQEVKRLADKLAKDCDYSLLDLSKVIHAALVESNYHEEAIRLEHYFNARFNDVTNGEEAASYLGKQLFILHFGPSLAPVRYGPYSNEKSRESAIRFIVDSGDFDPEDDYLLKMDGFAKFGEAAHTEEETLEDFIGDVLPLSSNFNQGFSGNF